MNARKWLMLMVAVAMPLFLGFDWWPWGATKSAGGPLEIQELALTGEIAGENATFALAFSAQVSQPGVELELARGLTSQTGGEWAESVKLSRDGDAYLLRFTKSGTFPVRFEFAARAQERENGDREVAFSVPSATVRRVEIRCDRPDTDVRIAGAADLKNSENLAMVALLPPGQSFKMNWKPEVRRLDGALMVSCDVNTIARARVGALQLDSLVQYRIAQGNLQNMELLVPAGLQITQVRGEDVREWTVRQPPPGKKEPRILSVALSRPKERAYQLQVEGELVLAAFPAKAELPFLAPRNVIRTSGFVLVGADSAIKLVVSKAAGLTQVDQTAFPTVALTLKDAPVRQRPTRGTYAYQYANLPCQMELLAEDIVTGLFADDRLVLNLENGGLVLTAVTELDIRDAPTRELVVVTDPAWTVANVAGAQLADHDVRDQDGTRVVTLHFREALIGRHLVEIRLERNLAAESAGFAAPLYRVEGAKAERGVLVCRAEQGIQLQVDNPVNLREVHPKSLPTAVPGAQSAWRFKAADWAAQFQIEKAAAAVHAEQFQLASVGEGTLFGSCSITYSIVGAPVRAFRVAVPASCQNVEFTGRDIRGWSQDGDVFTVTLQDKVMGDYTLLVTYDQPLAENGEVKLGGIRTLDTASAVGYIALAGPASVALDKELGRDKATLPLNVVELPREYLLLVNDPLLTCFKFVSQKEEPHGVYLALKRRPTLPPLTQVADHQTLETRIGRDGEAVTTATWFVKNSSQQYLHVNLPKVAKLWSAAVDGRAVQALDDGSGTVLVPLERRRDPNLAAQVTLVYAEAQGQVNWRRKLTFTAPTTDAKSVFARWTFRAPEACSLEAAQSNMLPEQRPAVSRLRVLAEAIGKIMSRYTGSWLLVVLFGTLLGGMTLWLAYSRAAGRLGHWSSLLAILGGVLLLILTLVIVGNLLAHVHFTALPEPLTTLSLTKPVTLADSQLAVELTVSSNAFLLTVKSALAGLAAIVGSLLLWKRARRSRLLAGIGLALLVWAAVGFNSLLPLMALLVTFAPVLALWIIGLRWAYRAGRKQRLDPTDPTDPTDRTDLNPTAPPTTALLLALALGLASGTSSWAQDQTPPPPPVPVMEQVTVAVIAPDVTTRDNKGLRDAKVSMELTFTAKQGERFLLLAKPFILESFKIDRDRLYLSADNNGYWLDVRRDGTAAVTMEFLAPVVPVRSGWGFMLPMPANLRNRITVSLPGASWDVAAAEAVWLHSAESPKDAAKGTTCELITGPTPSLTLTWQPRTRATHLEKAEFFAETNSLALFQPGLVSLTHDVRLQIAQGELQALQLEVPAGMNVTAVTGAGIGTWRFEPETRRLELLLDSPVSGDYSLQVVTQMPQENLPYTALLAPLKLPAATRQRGTLAVATTAAVQVRVAEPEGLTGMNVSDFVTTVANNKNPSELPEIKRAFRFQQLPATVRATAEKVLPELRVAESAQVDVSDERITFSSALTVSIAKAGVFSLWLDTPEGYEVDSLTGDGISHWDEIKDGQRGVLVHFAKQAMGDRQINIVLSHAEKGIPPLLVVPNVAVRDAVKQTGTLLLSGERGVRFTPDKREGVSELNPRDLGIEQSGVIAFKLLRPDWQVTLKAETLAPVVKSEMLERVNLSEGMLAVRATIEYAIEHAGVKLFRVQAPTPDTALTVTGRNIARVQKIDAAQGIWEIELTGKVEKEYRLEVSCQVPYDHQSEQLLLTPLRTLGTDAQKSWLALFASGRLQVKPGELPDGLDLEDPRLIPGDFKAGDLAGAVLCVRFSKTVAAVPLAVVRHDAADTLPGKVTQVRLASVVSDDFQMLTRAELALEINNLRFLEVTLPNGVELWSAFVNGKAAVPLVEKGVFLIPLDAGTAQNAVELLFSGAATVSGRRLHFTGPRFNLPLANVEWDFFLPTSLHYYGVDGTLRERAGQGEQVAVFSTDQYSSDNQALAQASVQKAEQVLEQGNQLFASGQQLEARKAMKSAVAYSQGKQDLNEDARIQYRNVLRQQAIVGLNNRRNVLKIERNSADQAAQQQNIGFNDGNFDADYSRRVEQSLSAEEQSSLSKVAEKILDQQAAAEAEINPIRITLPEQGVKLRFFRDLQIQEDAPMELGLSTISDRWSGLLARVGTAIGLVLLLALAARLARSGGDQAT